MFYDVKKTHFPANLDKIIQKDRIAEISYWNQEDDGYPCFVPEGSGRDT
jgi:hypothetical protein